VKSSFLDVVILIVIIIATKGLKSTGETTPPPKAGQAARDWK
jgi:hypothetical protein